MNYLTQRQREEILRFAPGLADRFYLIEDGLSEYLTGKSPRVAALLQEIADEFGPLGSRDEFTEIALLAKDMLTKFDAMTTNRKEELGGLLSDYAGHKELCEVPTLRPNSQRSRDCPTNLAPYFILLRRLYEGASILGPDKAKRGAPARTTELIQSLMIAAGPYLPGGIEQFDKEAFRPSGPFCKLVEICFEAIRVAPPSNIPQAVRRAFLDWVSSESRAEVEDAEFKRHADQKCDASQCHYCSM